MKHVSATIISLILASPALATEIVSIEIDTPDTVETYNKALINLRSGQKEIASDLEKAQAKVKEAEKAVADAKEKLAHSKDEYAKAMAKNKFIANVDKLEAVQEELDFLKDEQLDLSGEESELMERIASLSMEINPVVMPAAVEVEVPGKESTDRMISSGTLAE